jgi:hypothetical protein
MIPRPATRSFDDGHREGAGRPVAAPVNRAGGAALFVAVLAAACGAPHPAPADRLALRCHDARGRVMAMVSTEAECKFEAGEWRRGAPAPASAPVR